MRLPVLLLCAVAAAGASAVAVPASAHPVAPGTSPRSAAVAAVRAQVGGMARTRGASTRVTAAAAAAAPSAGAFNSVAPARLLDTRTKNGGSTPGSGGTVHLQVTGRGGVPVGVTAVVLNVTAVAPAANGYITVYADGGTRPNASNLNFAKGRTTPNLVVAPVNPTTGKVALYNGAKGSVNLLADVDGYYTPGTPSVAGSFKSLKPARLLDTRTKNGGSAPVSGGTVHLQVTGRGGVPAASSVSSVVLNVTVVSPTAAGYVTAYADAAARPASSNVNFAKGQTVPNLVVAPINPTTGKVSLYNGAKGTIQLVADVAGYYLKGTGTPTAEGTFTPVGPDRLEDTRADEDAPLASHKTLSVQASGLGSPIEGVSAVVLNVTVVSPQAGGYLTVSAAGTARPATSNLNFGKGQVVANQVVVPVGDDGTDNDGMIDIYNGATASTEVVVDVAGFFYAQDVGVVTGKITSSSGAAEHFAAAYVYDADGTDPVNGSVTTGTGVYTLAVPVTGSYKVCFDGEYIGAASECYNNVAWNGTDSLPSSGATSLSLTVPGSRTGINAALAAG